MVLSVFVAGRFGLELFRIRYVTLAAALTLILTIAPVYAAPNLKVGSTASYSLAASLSATQSCTASPASYYNQACLGIYPPTVFVTISDDRHCEHWACKLQLGSHNTGRKIQLRFQPDRDLSLLRPQLCIDLNQRTLERSRQCHSFTLSTSDRNAV